MNESYYDILGVDRDADTEAIKKAYRVKAFKHHPDVNEDKDDEEFKKVQEAYDCLSDPERRAHYDKFGTDAQTPESEAEKGLPQILASIIAQVDARHVDVVDRIQRQLKGELRAMASEKTAYQHQIDNHKQGISRLKHSGKVNPVLPLLEGKISGLNQQIAEANYKEKVLKAMLELLKDYSYEVGGMGEPGLTRPHKFIVWQDEEIPKFTCP